MVIQINLSNKTFYLLVGILAALCVAVVVIAYNSGNPQVHGHSANEIEGIGGGGGSSSQALQVVGTTDVSLPKNWADADNMVIDMTTSGGDVLLMFSASFYASGDHGDVSLRFVVDGEPKHYIVDKNPDLKTDAGEIMPISFQWLVKGLDAGSHTFKVQWRRGWRSVQQKGTTYPRVFTAIEI